MRFLTLILASILALTPVSTSVFAQTTTPTPAAVNSTGGTTLASPLLQPATGDSFWGAGGLRIVSSSCPFGSLNCKDDAALNGISGVTSVVLKLLGGLLALAAVVAVVFLVVAGGRLVLAGGNDEAVKSAHKHILYTLIGLFVVILSLVIVRNVTNLLYSTTNENVGGRALPIPASAVLGGISADQVESATDLTCPANSVEVLLEIERGYVASFDKTFDTSTPATSKASQEKFDAAYKTASDAAKKLAGDNGISIEFEDNIILRALLIDAAFVSGDAAGGELKDFLAKVVEIVAAKDDVTKTQPMWRDAATIFARDVGGSHGATGKDFLNRYADDLEKKGTTAKSALIARAKTNMAALASLCGTVNKAAPVIGQKVLGAVCNSITSCTTMCNAKPWPTGDDAAMKTDVNDITKHNDGKFDVVGASSPYLTPEALAGLKKAANIAKQRGGYRLVVTGAYRTLQAQIQLACDDIKNNSGRKLPSKIAWPGGSNHGTGTAVDVKLKDAAGRFLTTAGTDTDQNAAPNTKATVDLLQSIMAEAGWVRYCKEIWHFEFGASLGSNRSTTCGWPVR